MHSSGERRLIFRSPPAPEVLAEQIIESVRASDEEKLLSVAREMETGVNQESIFSRLAEEAEKFTELDRGQIQWNLGALEHRAAVTLTQAELSQLKKFTNELRKRFKKKESPQPAASVPEAVPGSVEQLAPELFTLLTSSSSVTDEKIDALLPNILALALNQQRALLNDVCTRIQKVMQPTERTNIARNIADLEPRILNKFPGFLNFLKRTGIEYAANRMRAELDREAPSPSDQQKEGEDEKIKPATQSIAKQWWNPTTWTPEERSKAAMIAGTGAIVIGGMLLIKWLWGKAGSAAGKVKEEMGKGWVWLKFGLLASVLTVCGYLGISAFSKYKKKISELNKLMKLVEEGERKLHVLTGEAKQAQERYLSELRSHVTRLRSGAQESDAVLPEEVQRGGEVRAESSTPLANEENEKLQARAKELAKKGATMTKEEVLVTAILSMEIIPWALDEEAKKNQLIGLLKNNREKKMGEIFDAQDNASQESPLVMASEGEDIANREMCVDVMMEYCDQHRPKIIEAVMKKRGCTAAEADDAIRSMNFEQYLEHAAATSNMYVRAMSQIEGKSGNLLDALHNLTSLDHAYILGGDADVQEALRIIACEIDPIDVGFTKEELESIDITELLMAALGSARGNVRDEYIRLQKAAITPSEKMLMKVLEKLIQETNTTHRVMLPLFHEVFPTDEPMDAEKKVRMYILDRMTPAEALRFYLYHRMIEQGNVLAIPLMQLDIIRFIARHDDSILPGYKKYMVLARMGASLTMLSGSTLAEEWKKLGITMDIQLTDDQMQALNHIGLTMLCAPFATTAEYFNAVRGSGMAYPKIATGIFAGSALVRRSWVRYGGRAFNYLSDPKGFAARLRALPNTQGSPAIPTRIIGRVRASLPWVLYSHDELADAKHAYHMIFAEGIDKIDPSATKTAIVRLRRCITNPRLASRWKLLADELDTLKITYPELQEASHQARLLAGHGGVRLRGALNTLRLPFRWGGKWAATLVVPAFNAVTVLEDRVISKTAEASAMGLEAIRKSRFLHEALRQTGMKLDDLLAFLSKIHIPPMLANAFARSKGAMLMLLNAAKSGGASALEYLIKLGAFAQRLAPVAGRAAIGLDVILCAVEMAMNRERIKATENPALRELYAAKYKVSVAGAAAGTAMGVAWSAVGWAPAGALVSASTFAPAVLGIAVAKYSHDQIEKVTETWLSDEKDWKKKELGELRQRMRELGPGKYSYWQGAVGGTRAENWYRRITMGQEYQRWQENVMKTMLHANDGARFKMLRAYMAKMTDLPVRDMENEEQYALRFAQFQMDQMSYIGYETGGSFGSDNGLLYQHAHSHAELLALAHALKKHRQSQTIMVEKGGAGGAVEQKEFNLEHYADFVSPDDRGADGIGPRDVIMAFERQKRVLTLMEVTALKEQGNSVDVVHCQDYALQHLMLMEVRHDLALFDSRLREANLPGWEWTGGECDSRDLLRYVVSVELRKMFRGEADQLRKKIDVTVDDLEASIMRIQSFLQQNPMDLFQPKLEQRYLGVAEFAGNTEILVDASWLAEHLYVTAA